jgi:hypothetical protein
MDYAFRPLGVGKVKYYRQTGRRTVRLRKARGTVHGEPILVTPQPHGPSGVWSVFQTQSLGKEVSERLVGEATNIGISTICTVDSSLMFCASLAYNSSS